MSRTNDHSKHRYEKMQSGIETELPLRLSYFQQLIMIKLPNEITTPVWNDMERLCKLREEYYSDGYGVTDTTIEHLQKSLKAALNNAEEPSSHMKRLNKIHSEIRSAINIIEFFALYEELDNHDDFLIIPPPGEPGFGTLYEIND